MATSDININDSDRARMAGLVAKWAIPTPEELDRARRAGHKLTKPRATAEELAERREVTTWLVETAGRSLSRRGVAYRAEALLGLPKTHKAFRLIEEMTLTLREEGAIPWSSIRDGRRTATRWVRIQSLSEYLRRWATRNRLDSWQDAEVQCQLWVAKADLASALEPVAMRLMVDLYPAAGFTGRGFLREGIEHAAEDGRPLVLLLMEDFDSSGNRAREALTRSAERYAAELGLELRAVETIALTRDQVIKHEIPTRPQKEGTHRREGDDDLAAELDAVDALHPELLPQWIEQAVDRHCPAELRAEVKEQEAEDTDQLLEWADELEEEDQ